MARQYYPGSLIQQSWVTRLGIRYDVWRSFRDHHKEFGYKPFKSKDQTRKVLSLSIIRRIREYIAKREA